MLALLACARWLVVELRELGATFTKRMSKCILPEYVMISSVTTCSSRGYDEVVTRDSRGGL